MKKRALGYIRVSTGQQVREGSSIDAQHSIIMEMAERDDAKLIDILTDEGLSGRKNIHKRLSYTKLVSLITGKQVDIIYAYSLSRLGRKTSEVLSLFDLCEKNGVVISTYKDQINTGTAIGKLIRTILVAFAEFEGDLASERTMDVARNNKKEFKPYCNPPYGWKIVGRILDEKGKVVQRGHLVEVQEEQQVLNWILNKRKTKSLSAIAEALNLDNIKPKRGKIWSHGQVKSVIETSKSFREMVKAN